MILLSLTREQAMAVADALPDLSDRQSRPITEGRMGRGRPPGSRNRKVAL